MDHGTAEHAEPEELPQKIILSVALASIDQIQTKYKVGMSPKGEGRTEETSIHRLCEMEEHRKPLKK